MVFLLHPSRLENHSLSLREQRLLGNEAHGADIHPEAAHAAPATAPKPAADDHAKSAADAHASKPAAPAAAPEAKPAVKDAHAEHAHDAHAAPEHDLPSVYDITRRKLKSVLGTTAKVGAFAGLPFLTIPAWLGDKIAMNTFAKIPVLGKAYTKPRELVMSAADKALGLTSDLVAAPTLAIDLGEKVLDVLHGKKADSADSLVGKLMHKTTDAMKEVLKLGWNGTKWTLGSAKDVLKAVFVDSGIFTLLRDLPKIVISSYGDALKNHPKSTILGTIVAGSVIATTGGTTAAGQAILNAGLKLAEGLGALMQGAGHWLGV